LRSIGPKSTTADEATHTYYMAPAPRRPSHYTLCFLSCSAQESGSRCVSPVTVAYPATLPSAMAAIGNPSKATEVVLMVRLEWRPR
jgi:hypothetical protein